MRQLARWQAAGLQMHMAVNVSMENLRVAGLRRRVSAGCARPACRRPT